MIHTLENARLRIQISDDGAELVSIFDKQSQKEILWQADPAFWKRHAPVLFPNVGKHYKNTYRVNGTEYASSQHGFARDSVFTCEEKTDSSVTHVLTANEKTLAAYPFHFILKITHTLKENQVLVSWEVADETEEISFTIGAHPAFAIPYDTYTDYRLYFKGLDTLRYMLLDGGCAVTDQLYTLHLTDESIALTRHMFDRDALVVDDQISVAGILTPDGKPYVEVASQGFSNYGIWSVPGAPFVCLEPWAGRTDNVGFTGELKEKPFIQKAAPGQPFKKSFSITVF